MKNFPYFLLLVISIEYDLIKFLVFSTTFEFQFLMAFTIDVALIFKILYGK